MNYLSTHWLISLAGTISLGIAAMVLHEFGHIVTSLMVGIKVKSVGMCMKGMYVVRDAGPPAKNLLVSLAGPLTNVVLVILFWQSSQTFAWANMCLAICNLAPVRGSDGDRAWSCYEQMQKESSPAPQMK